MVGYPQLFIKLAYIYGPGYLCTLDGVHRYVLIAGCLMLMIWTKLAHQDASRHACIHACLSVPAMHVIFPVDSCVQILTIGKAIYLKATNVSVY